MKKLLAFVLAIIMLVALVACSSNSAPASSAAPVSSAAPASSAAPTSSQQSSAVEEIPKITLRFAHVQGVSSPLTAIFNEFVESVSNDSNGAITIEHYPASQLGTETEIVDSLVTNSLDMAQCAPAQGIVWDSDRRISLLAMPTAFHSVEHLKKAVYRDEVASWLDDLAAQTNIRILNVMLSGERHITSNKEIMTPADMVGMKFRAATAANIIAYAKALGTEPVAMPISEVYLALQQGVADSQENPIPTIIANKFHEVQKYLIKTGHTFQCIMVGFSEKKWQTLTDVQQEIIKKNLIKAQEDSYVIIPEQSITGEQTLRDYGTIIINPDKEAFYAAGEIMVDSLVPEYGNEIREIYDFAKSLD